MTGMRPGPYYSGGTWGTWPPPLVMSRYRYRYASISIYRIKISISHNIDIASLCDIHIASISISHSNIDIVYRYRMSHNINIACVRNIDYRGIEQWKQNVTNDKHKLNHLWDRSDWHVLACASFTHSFRFWCAAAGCFTCTERIAVLLTWARDASAN